MNKFYHVVQTVAPGEAVEVPEAHATHAEALAAPWYWPAKQTEQVVAAAAAKVPTPHTEQLEAPVLPWALPATHGAQAVALAPP